MSDDEDSPIRWFFGFMCLVAVIIGLVTILGAELSTNRFNSCLAAGGTPTVCHEQEK